MWWCVFDREEPDNPETTHMVWADTEYDALTEAAIRWFDTIGAEDGACSLVAFCLPLPAQIPKPIPSMNRACEEP